MKDRVFLDTNMIVYLYSEDESKKQSLIFNILEAYHCVISTQVLNEFCSVCLRKFGMPVNKVALSINEITENCELHYINKEVIEKALMLKDQYGYAYYDCLILASAILSECKYLYSEDMQHNQIIEGNLNIINPFL